MVAIGGSNRLIGCKEAAEFLSVPERTDKRELAQVGAHRTQGGTRDQVPRARHRDLAAEEHPLMADV